jgi:hypothetical protein
MKVDEGQMYLAIDPHRKGLREAHGSPFLHGFLNCRTGAIAFRPEDGERADEDSSVVPAIEFAAQRAAVANRPRDWVMIPTYDKYGSPQGGEDAFIRGFLAEVVHLAPGEVLELC